MNQQIQIENDGGNLANFKPLDHSIKITKKNEIIPPSASIETDSEWNQILKGLKPQESIHPSFASTNLGKNADYDQTALYNNAYDVPSNVSSWSRESSGTSMNTNINNKSDQRLLDKINYMIYLLEQQQNEKTNNSLEEFVMFSLVGVFIIYVLDSFSRSARYTR
jgi:hypothetical protein